MASQSPTPLSEERRGQIEESFSGVASSNEYLERTSHVLALISSGMGVALGQCDGRASAGTYSFLTAFRRTGAGRC
jgi:hypothetical protein